MTKMIVIVIKSVIKSSRPSGAGYNLSPEKKRVLMMSCFIKLFLLSRNVGTEERVIF